jgi:DNA-binding PadR family transcriptional regulator
MGYAAEERAAMGIRPWRLQTPLAVAVLVLLDERPMHPYEMQVLIRGRRFDQVLKLNSGSLYHTVERLVQTQLIEPAATNREGRRPERTVYAITEAGRDELHSWLRDELEEPATEYPRFAAALAFMAHLDQQEVIELLQVRALSLERSIRATETLYGGLREQGLDRMHLVEVEYTQALRRAELSWLRALVEDLLAGTLAWPALAAENDGRGVLPVSAS